MLYLGGLDERAAHFAGGVALRNVATCYVMDCRSKERRRPTSSNKYKPKVSLSLGKGNPRDEHKEHFIYTTPKQRAGRHRRNNRCATSLTSQARRS